MFFELLQSDFINISYKGIFFYQKNQNELLKMRLYVL